MLSRRATRASVTILSGILAAGCFVLSAQAANFQLLYSFGNSGDGSSPYAGLVKAGTTFYGTTRYGGADNEGTVFGITEAGTESMLYSFAGGTSDGANPEAALTKIGKALYGTTASGGPVGGGTAFAITEAGDETVLHDFGESPDGYEPYGRLLKAGHTLYGTTYLGGANSDGTVFTLTQAGNEAVLYAFNDSNDNDGFSPAAGLIKVGRELYGTTSGGGAHGRGTVFAISESGKESIIYSFAGGSSDGANPTAGLVNVHGTLYGTTYEGVANDNGIAFAVSTSGAETVLHSFSGGTGDGSFPAAGLIDVDGTLYGTTLDGGEKDDGTIFSITPQGVETVVHSFVAGNGDGSFPQANMIKVGKTLYGTTTEGGDHGGGTIFELPLSP